MKRIIIAFSILCVLLTAVFTGCSQNGNNTTNTISTIKATEPELKDENGIGYNSASDKSLTISQFTGSNSNLKIPSEYKGKKVTEVGRSSFKMKNITSVTIPETVTKIDNYAFAFSRELEKAVIPDSVKEIGTNAFAGCIKLKEVTLPKKLEKLGAFAFDATAIEKITIPKKVKKIEDYTFAECGSLKEVVFNSKDTEIADTAFNKSINIKITAPKNSKAVEFAESNGIDYRTK